MFSYEKDKYKSLDRDEPIMEAKEDLEQTGKFNKEHTAFFGQSVPAKKNAKISDMPKVTDINQIGFLSSKTPNVMLIKDVSPQKVIYSFLSNCLA